MSSSVYSEGATSYNDFFDEQIADNSDELYEQFDTLQSEHVIRESKSNVIALTGPRVYALNAYEISKVVIYDRENESKLFSKMNSLHSLLHICDKIVNLVNIVSSIFLGHIVDSSGQHMTKEIVSFTSGKNSKAQSQRSISDDAKKKLKHFINAKRVRFVLSHSIILTRKLGTAILAAAELLKSEKGSRISIETAKANIVQGLNELEMCIDNVKKLDKTLSVIFDWQENQKLQADLDLDILSPEVSNYHQQIKRLEKTQKEKHSAIRCQLGKVTSYSHLISATEKMLPRSHENVQAKTERMKSLELLIAETQKIIDNIPASASTTEYWQWLYWWSNIEDILKENNEEISTGDGERHYYESITLARKSQFHDAQYEMKEWYNVFNGEYKNAEEQLEKTNENFKAEMTKCQGDIDELKNSLANHTYNLTEMEHEMMLVEYMNEIRAFITSIEQGQSAFSPLIGILSDIKTLVQTDMKLLSSEDKGDIFIAGKRLRKQAAFITSLSEMLVYL